MMIAGRYWTFMMAVIGITIGDAAGVIEGGVCGWRADR